MKRLLPYILALAFLEILIIPFFLKLNSIRFLIIPDEETKNHLISQIIAHDSIIYAFIISLIYISYLKNIPNILSYFLRGISILIFSLYIIDIFVLKNFVTHININDINKYLTYAPKYISQQYEINIFHIAIILAIIILVLIFIRKNLIIQKTHHYIFISIIIISISTNSFSKDEYVHSWVYKNFIEYNLDLLEQSKDYSNYLKKNISIDDKIVCQNEKANKKNIIILMVESFASYQSKFFSGIKDWTPNLDKIASSNISIKNFYSNGFITEDAEISILTGLFPIYSPQLKAGLGSTAFQGFYSIKDSLPNILKESNYQTEFITSSDLTFSNTGKWAESLGFNYIEGSEHPFYNDKQRYHFEAPADEFLLKRVINRIDIKKEEEIPYFMFIKTVSSHIPFLNPETNNYSEEETIKYVDKQIGNFYKKLKKRDFFKNGILIIVGDHHPIIPLKKEQINKYGLFSAGLRVPFIVSYGEKINNQLNGKFHQVDIYNSIKNLTSSRKCTSLWRGDFLKETPVNPNFVVYRRGDKRGIITVYNQKNELFNIKLNGDNTKLINEKKSEKTKIIINKINYERIKRQENEL